MIQRQLILRREAERTFSEQQQGLLAPFENASGSILLADIEKDDSYHDLRPDPKNKNYYEPGTYSYPANRVV
jgi:hypothetical protein